MPYSSNMSIANISQGRDGNEEATNGSVGNGRSFAQMMHLETICSIIVGRPGHHTDVRALDRHLIMPWMY